MSERMDETGPSREDTILAYTAMVVLVAAIALVVAVTLLT